MISNLSKVQNNNGKMDPHNPDKKIVIAKWGVFVMMFTILNAPHTSKGIDVEIF